TPRSSVSSSWPPVGPSFSSVGAYFTCVSLGRHPSGFPISSSSGGSPSATDHPRADLRPRGSGRFVISVDSGVGIHLKAPRHRTRIPPSEALASALRTRPPGGPYHGGCPESTERNPGARRPDRGRLLAEVDHRHSGVERHGEVDLRDPVPDGRDR